MIGRKDQVRANHLLDKLTTFCFKALVDCFYCLPCVDQAFARENELIPPDLDYYFFESSNTARVNPGEFLE